MTPSEARAARPIRPEDREALASMLARAFADDPLTRFFVRQGGGREDRARRLFGWFLDEAMAGGYGRTLPDRAGAALWMGPGEWDLPLLRQIRNLPTIVRVVGARHLPSRMAASDAIQRRHPSEPHLYLAVLGTDPARQGHGLGTALLAAGTRECDRLGLPAYLETSNPRNLPLYERHGFRVRERIDLPFEGPVVWTMWRAAV